MQNSKNEQTDKHDTLENKIKTNMNTTTNMKKNTRQRDPDGVDYFVDLSLLF